jgi:hypothetical protein
MAAGGNCSVPARWVTSSIEMESACMKSFFTVMTVLTLFAVDAVTAQTSLNTSYLGRWGFGGSSPMFTRGNYGFFFGSGKMYLFDISNREQLRRVGEYDIPLTKPALFDSLIVGTMEGGIRIVNISDPTAPVVSSLPLSVPPQDYAVQKNLLFVAAQGEGLIIYDIADQKNPSLKASFKTSGSAFDIAVAQEYAFVGTLPSGIQVIHCANMDSLSSVAVIPIVPVTRMRTVGTSLVIAYKDSLAVYDISAPHAPAGIFSFAPGTVTDFQYRDSKLYTVGQDECQIYSFHNLSSLVSIGYVPNAGGSVLHVSPSFISFGGYAGCSLWDTASTGQAKHRYLFSSSHTLNSVGLRNNVMVVADGRYIQTIDRRTFSQLGEYISDDPFGAAFDLAVRDTLAFTASGSAGVVIYNIADPANMKKLGVYDSPGQARALFIQGNICYVADAGSGLRIVDVSNPSVPVEKGSYDTPGSARGVTVKDNKAYIADGGSGLLIVGVSDTAVPQLLGSYNTPGYAVNVAVNETDAFVADESGGIRMIDIRNTSLPVEKGFWSANTTVYSVALSGNRLYAACGNSGLQVFDITDSLKGIGFSTFGTAEKVHVYHDTVYVSAGLGDVWLARYNTETSVTNRTVSVDDFRLLQNYPNPFNPSTTISVSLPYGMDADVRIFNALGQQVAVLHEGPMTAGAHQLRWDASSVAAGVYFCRFRSGPYSQTRKLSLVK